MSASPELRRSPAALDPRPPPSATHPNSPMRHQLHRNLLPLHVDPTPTTNNNLATGSAPSAAPDHHQPPPATRGGDDDDDDDFRTPTDEQHRIPTAAAASCGCPPAPRKPRPSAPSAPACRRRLIQGELLRIAPEEVERLFGRTWTRDTVPSAPPAAAAAVAPTTTRAASGPAVLPAKKRKRCYAQVTEDKE